MTKRLDTSEMYPAGLPGVSSSAVRIRTGIELRVAESGPAGGPPVILLHGWGASLYMHRCALEELGDAGYHAIAPDLRGHGLSDKPGARGAYSLDAFLDDALAVLDAFGVARAVMVGQSMGGAVALHMALRAASRVASLVLINPVGLGRSRYPLLGKAIGHRVMERLSPHIPPRWMVAFILRRLAYGDPSRVTERDVDEYWASARDPRYAAAVHAMLREFDWEPIPQSELARVRVPTLVVVGKSDRLLRRTAVAARAIPGVRVEVMGGGHSVNEERGREVCELLLGFLRDHPPSGSRGNRM